jgi:hypothetical protein
LANRTYLLNHDSDVPVVAAEIEGRCLLAANYQLPILWVALFDKGDLTTVGVPCTNYAGDEVVEKIPTLFTSAEKAKSNYASRRATLIQSMGDESIPFIKEWDAFANTNLSAPYAQVDLVELWMMYDNPADLSSDVSEWLTAVASPFGTSWDNLCFQACFTDPDVRRYGIRGFPWQAELAWA